MTLSLAIIQDLRSSFLIFTPKELTISETTESTSIASYLNLLFIRDKNNNIMNKLYDNGDAFGFHNVSFLFVIVALGHMGLNMEQEAMNGAV